MKHAGCLVQQLQALFGCCFCAYCVQNEGYSKLFLRITKHVILCHVYTERNGVDRS